TEPRRRPRRIVNRPDKLVAGGPLSRPQPPQADAGSQAGPGSQAGSGSQENAGPQAGAGSSTGTGSQPTGGRSPEGAGSHEGGATQPLAAAPGAPVQDAPETAHDPG